MFGSGSSVDCGRGGSQPRKGKNMSDSSKGQQQQQDLVDDSWEEIDEDRLAVRLSKLSNDEDGSGQPSGSEGTSSSSRPGARAPPANSLPAMLEEELRPRMILQRPQMQILRRPQSSQAQSEAEKAATEGKPKTQIKSLDQRKQEYAEARLRILGSAHDEEEQQQTKQIEQAPKKGSPNTNGYRINNINNNSNSGSSANNSTNNNGGNIRLDRPQNAFRPPPGNYHMPQLPSQHPGGPFYGPHPSGRNQLPPEATGSLNHHYYPQQPPQVGPHIPGGYHYQHHQQQQQHQQQHHHPPHLHHQKHIGPYGMPPHSSSGYHHGMGPIPAYGGPLGHNSNNNVLRTPAGPDGSHGFTMRR